MDKNPKRRKYQDNPYLISKDEEKNLYVVTFKDGAGVMQEIQISKEIWEIFDEYEKEDLKIMNEFDRHTEHSEIYENSLVTRADKKTLSLEDDFIMQATFEELKKAIDMLPETQKRRIKKYYFEDKNMYQIAEEERVSVKNVSEVLSVARENLKNILKNLI